MGRILVGIYHRSIVIKKFSFKNQSSVYEVEGTTFGNRSQKQKTEALAQQGGTDRLYLHPPVWYFSRSIVGREK
jgi:hypothetical protein